MTPKTHHPGNPRLEQMLKEWAPQAHRQSDSPKLRLVTFPSAGASFSAFGRTFVNLPPGVEHCPIQYPGRMGHPAGRHHSSVQSLAREGVEVLAPLLNVPTAFVGYSLGGVVAFELAHALRAAGKPGPTNLFVISRSAPNTPSKRPWLHTLVGDQFQAGLERRYGPISPILKNEPELLKMFLAITQQDLAASETYRNQNTQPLNCDIHAWVGAKDTSLSVEVSQGWEAMTTGRFDLDVLPGGHFLLEGHSNAIGGAIAAEAVKAVGA